MSCSNERAGQQMFSDSSAGGGGGGGGKQLVGQGWRRKKGCTGFGGLLMGWMRDGEGDGGELKANMCFAQIVFPGRRSFLRG